TYITGFKYYKYISDKSDNKRNIDIGSEITDEDTINKIKKLKIPPSYDNVVILNNKKIIAYGYDSKGRKQVIYNSKHVEKQNEQKYEKIKKFDKHFIKIKKQVAKDLKSSDEKNKIIAIIITLILSCGFRIGNIKYEKQNKSYGITTLNYSHIKLLNDNTVSFDFIGKKGVRNQAICKNKYIYAYLSEKLNILTTTTTSTSESPEYIFKYNNRRITADDVNNYLMCKLKVNITTKDLRTWNANNLFNKYLHKYRNEKNPIKKALELTSFELHNTSTVCKKSYIDPMRLLKAI
ncbi:MAG: DNA topoisomerase IB, partial [Chitinophagia bacterium]|nr:DNA topoisomerase IB [Chitinophagia bacterium]